MNLSLGAKAVFSIWGLMWGWNLLTWLLPDFPPHQTISETFARGLANPRTRVPVAVAIFANVLHVFALARRVHPEGCEI